MGFNERIVDSNNVDVIVLNVISEDNTTNAAETVDSNLGGCHDSGKLLEDEEISIWWVEINTLAARALWEDGGVDRVRGKRLWMVEEESSTYRTDG